MTPVYCRFGIGAHARKLPESLRPLSRFRRPARSRASARALRGGGNRSRLSRPGRVLRALLHRRLRKRAPEDMTAGDRHHVRRLVLQWKSYRQGTAARIHPANLRKTVLPLRLVLPRVAPLLASSCCALPSQQRGPFSLLQHPPVSECYQHLDARSGRTQLRLVLLNEHRCQRLWKLIHIDYAILSRPRVARPHAPPIASPSVPASPPPDPPPHPRVRAIPFRCVRPPPAAGVA